MVRSITFVILLGFLASLLIPQYLHEFFIFAPQALAWGFYILGSIGWLIYLYNPKIQLQTTKLLIERNTPLSLWKGVDHLLMIGLCFMLEYYFLAAFISLAGTLYIRSYLVYRRLVLAVADQMAADIYNQLTKDIDTKQK